MKVDYTIHHTLAAQTATRIILLMVYVLAVSCCPEGSCQAGGRQKGQLEKPPAGVVWRRAARTLTGRIEGGYSEEMFNGRYACSRVRRLLTCHGAPPRATYHVEQLGR